MREPASYVYQGYFHDTSGIGASNPPAGRQDFELAFLLLRRAKMMSIWLWSYSDTGFSNSDIRFFRLRGW